MACPSRGSFARDPVGTGPPPAGRRRAPWRGLLLAGVVLLLGPFARGQAPVLVLTDAVRELALGPWMEVLEDPEGRLAIGDVSSDPTRKAFRPCGPRFPAFGFSQSVFWVRFAMHNPTEKDKLRLLEIAYPLLDHVEVYVSRAGPGWDVRVMGDRHPFADRDIANRNFVTSIFIPPGQTRHVFLRFRTDSSSWFPLFLWYPSDFIRGVIGESVVLGLCYGVMAAFALYSLFVFFSMRERNYLFLTLYILCYTILQMVLNGQAFQYFWPKLPGWNLYALPVMAGLTVFSMFFFTREFLGIHRGMTTLNALFRVMMLYAVLIPLAGIVWGYPAGVRLAGIGTLVSPTLAFAIGIVCRIRGHRYARYYLVAFCTFFIFATIYGLSKFGILPSTSFTEGGLYVGAVLKVFFLFFAIPDKINALQAEKETARARLIEALRHNEEIQERFNAELRVVNRSLEMKVEERTLDLAAKNAELTRQQAELQLAYDQLSRVDRMKTDFLSSVSHELRTPLTSILGFAKIIDRDYRKVAKALRLSGSDPGIEKSHLRIIEDLRIIILEVERLSRMINNVLDLAKIDSGKMEWQDQVYPAADLLLGVKSIGDGFFYNRPDLFFKAETAGVSGFLRIDRDRFIQVITNLFSNSAKFTRKGVVELRARRDGEDALVIAVSDTGAGIPPESLETIFEKFRQVGDTLTGTPSTGTGLGLTICKEIVDHYGGEIWVESTVGKGSTFHVRLPLCPSPEPSAGTPGDAGTV
ncbi:MAG: sensor histidine kinase [Acidobacteria bacterium]|nr:sensor histidine kinase [Acidobacteriota bacterium]